MGIYFRKRKNIAPGINLNVSDKNAGVSLGIKGLHVSTNTNGTNTMSASIPGTGLSARKTFKKSNSNPVFNNTQNNSSSNNTGNVGNNNKKPWYKRTWFIVLLSFFALIAFVSAFGNDNDSNNNNLENTTFQEVAISTIVDDLTTNGDNVSVSSEIDTTIPAPATTTVPISTPASTTTLPPTTTPAPTTTLAPTTTPVPTTTIQQTEATTTAPVPQQNLVWISETGKKYHSYSGCSNMNNPRQVTLDEAVSLGLEPCKRCH